MTPLYTDLDLLNIAEELRDESSVKYLYNALDGLRQKYEARIAELTPPAPTPETKEIPLTQNKVAIVDASDYDALNQYKWFARKYGRIYYAVRNTPRINGKRIQVLMHIAIMGKKGVDHISGCGLDNRRSNLRLATNQQNHFNERPRGGTSAFKGVHWYKSTKKWRAMIKLNGKNMHLGLFDDEAEAARVYDAKARELFGEYAWLNDKARGIVTREDV